MATIEESIAANRRRLQSGVEAPLLRSLVSDYARVLRRIESEARTLAQRLAQRQTKPTRSELLRMRRLDALATQVRDEMRTVSVRGAMAIREGRRVAILEGVADARNVGLEVGVRLNAPAVERITAALAPESPLGVLVNELPRDAAQAVRTALIDGVALGQNPRVVARAVRQALGGQATRALTISRTEVLRSYRGAALETFKANSRILQGWVWISAQDDRTCPICWAMHGTEFSVNDAFASHPNCRCSPGPLPVASPPEIGLGPDRFATLPETRQVAILGPAAWRAYASGAIALDDLVAEATHPQWGPIRFERSLKAILGQKQATEFYRREAA